MLGLQHRPDDAQAAAHIGSPTHTVMLGHSYGSLVVGEAATRAPGLATDLAFVGSPGVSVQPRQPARGARRARVRRGGQQRPGGPVGFQNWATGLDLGFYAARSYSLRRPPRTDRRLIRSQERSATG